MGCDIHFFVERKTDQGWEQVPGREEYVDWVSPKDGTEFKSTSWYSGRNYNLFAMLADVRNGYGFAGVDTGDPLIPIDEPRGLPADVCSAIREEHTEWDLDAHSASWFTLAELLAVDWKGKEIVHRGWVSPAGFLEWKENGHPSSWSGGISGGGIQHVDAIEMQRLIDSGEAKQPGPFGAKYYCQVQWVTTWAEAVGEHESGFLGTLEAMKLLGDPEDVRAVFWFDN